MSNPLHSSPNIDPLIYQKTPNKHQQVLPSSSTKYLNLTPFNNRKYFNENLFSYNNSPRFDIDFNITPYKEKDDDKDTDHQTKFQLTPKNIDSRFLQDKITPLFDRYDNHDYYDFGKDLQTITPSRFEGKKNNPKTPSKLRDITNHEFMTPKRKVVVSSPSTEIASSAVKEPVDVDTDEDEQNHHSPTPKMKIEPIMGIFSLKKRVEKKKQKKGGSMTKFQIVFTDVHTLMNNKSKRRKKGIEGMPSGMPSMTSMPSSTQSTIPSSMPQDQSQPNQQDQRQANLIPPTLASSYSSSFKSNSFSDHNLSINSSKEVSLISNNNNSNVSDHTSFDLTNLSSTPNSKYILDKIFEKNSPPNFNYYGNHNNNHMPPPKQVHPQLQQQHYQMYMQQQQQLQQQQHLHHIQAHPIQAHHMQQQQQQHMQHMQQPPPYAMMMSTPQHQHVMNYNSNMYHQETSPSNNDPGHLYNFQSPQKYSMVQMNGVQVMMPFPEEDPNIH